MSIFESKLCLGRLSLTRFRQSKFSNFKYLCRYTNFYGSVVLKKAENFDYFLEATISLTLARSSQSRTFQTAISDLINKGNFDSQDIYFRHDRR